MNKQKFTELMESGALIRCQEESVEVFVWKKDGEIFCSTLGDIPPFSHDPDQFWSVVNHCTGWSWVTEPDEFHMFIAHLHRLAQSDSPLNYESFNGKLPCHTNPEQYCHYCPLGARTVGIGPNCHCCDEWFEMHDTHDYSKEKIQKLIKRVERTL